MYIIIWYGSDEKIGSFYHTPSIVIPFTYEYSSNHLNREEMPVRLGKLMVTKFQDK